MRRLSIILLGGAVLLSHLCAVPSAAKAPWRLIGFRRVKADPNAEYRLSENEGPWLIFAASFAGDGAHAEARQLVLELRERYRLPAYLHSERFDFTDPVRGIGVNGDQSPKIMRYDKAGVFDEYAVLVGDFKSVDDPSLQKTLKRLKYAQPKTLTKQEVTTRRFAGLRELYRQINGDEDKRRKGPMRMAFATPNPMLPKEYFAPKGIDQFVLDMNRDVKFSLLDCPGRYTVRVATFRGNVILDQRLVEEIENGGKMESRLEEAAIKANRLTVALRKRGIQAYEFHDRHESYVTVGSFEWATRPQQDGKQQMNPAIMTIMQRFAPQQHALVGDGGEALAGLQPRTLEGIAFDVQPWPVEVPQRSLATDYARR